MRPALQVRAVLEQDRDDWLRLWAGYNRFYHATLTDAVTQATWQRILDPLSPVGCMVAESENGSIVGFANYVLHPRTWSLSDACYMEDLYVDEAARGQGVARALYNHLEAFCVSQGVSRLYWHTRETNGPARAFYDRVAEKDDFVRYVKSLQTDLSGARNFIKTS